MKTDSVRKIQLAVGIMLMVIILFQESQSFVQLSIDALITKITEHYDDGISIISSEFSAIGLLKELNYSLNKICYHSLPKF